VKIQSADVPPPNERSGAMFALRWIPIILVTLMGLFLLRLGFADSCNTRTAARFGAVVLGLAAFLLPLPGRLARLAPWANLRDGFAAGCGFLLLIVTVLAIPDFVSSRPACGERAAIADARAIAEAQAAYRRLNAGYFDSRLDCLRQPVRCIPGLGASQPGLVGEELTAANRAGYVRALVGGPPPSPMPITASRSSVTSFAYTAVPVTPGEDGVRGLCADSTGALCATPDGSAPRVRADGTCELGTCVSIR
jgi:hypothetical protein